jgi:hypothetical protein
MLVLGFLALVISNCGTFTPNRDATRTAEAVIVSDRLQQTMEADRYTQVVASATARMAEAHTAVAARQTAVAETQAAATSAAVASATAQAQEQKRANATATQQAAGMARLAEEYAGKGWLSSGEGLFRRVDDYTGDEPNIGKVLVRGTGYAPREFVMRAHVQYENAEKAANYALSSCGFIVWRVDEANYYQVYLGMDGYVYSNAVVRNRFYSLGKGFYGFPSLSSGEYDVTLIVSETHMRVLYNDKLVKTFLNIGGSQMDGKLYFAITSGVEKDFGTRCTFSNAELWEAAVPAD